MEKTGKSSLLITLLGRSEEGIRKDALNIFGSFDKVITVKRDKDTLAEGRDDCLTAKETIEFLRENSCRHNDDDDWPVYTNVTLVANGGTTAQLVPILLELVSWDINSESGELTSYYQKNIVEIDRDLNVTKYCRLVF